MEGSRDGDLPGFLRPWGASAALLTRYYFDGELAEKGRGGQDPAEYQGTSRSLMRTSLAPAS